jgi:predicted phosphodiesterase
VLFGHTHRPYAKYVDGMLVLNPGSVGMNRKTYAVLEVGHGEVKYELCELGMWD